MNVYQDFAALFEGRHDAYGTEEGSCIHMTGEGKDQHVGHLSRHIHGGMGLGVYPMTHWEQVRDRGFGLDINDGPWFVKWGCVDLDIAAPGKRRYDFATSEVAAAQAARLYVEAKANGVIMWPEKTRSGGYHVWLFAQEWVPAETMRKALVVLCGMSNTPITEVNPKQFTLPLPSSLGNYVRLPYFGNARPILAPRTWQPLTLETFCYWAQEARTPTETLTGLADQWLPVKPLLPTVGDPVQVDAAWLAALPPYLRVILRDGQGRQQDRSAWIYSLGCKAKDCGLSPEDGLSFIRVADQLHSQKYSERADADERYREIIERSYGNA